MLKNRFIKFLLYFTISLIVLLLLLWFVIRLPSVQNYAKEKILNSLSKQYDAKWTIDDIEIKFIDSAEATGILFRDQQGDTLFFADKLYIDIGLFSLLNRDLVLDDISTEKAFVNIYEIENSLLNFDFLTPPTDSAATTGSSKSWSIDINSIRLNNAKVSYMTSDLQLIMKQRLMEIDINKLDINKQYIDIEDIVGAEATIGITTGDATGESTPFELPDIGWDISIEETSILNYGININQDNPIKASVKEIKINDLRYTETALDLNIQQISGVYNNQLNLSETEAIVRVEGSRINLEKVKVKTGKDHFNIENGFLDLANNKINTSKLDLKVSYKTLKNFSAYIPRNIQILKNQEIRIKSDKLTYSPQELKTKNILIDYGDAINLVGSIDIRTKINQYNNPSSINVDLQKLTTNIKQLDNILRDFTLPDSLARYNTLTATGIAQGNMQELIISDLFISVDNVINLKATGVIADILENDKLSYDLNFINFDANVSELPIPINESIAIDSIGRIIYSGVLRGNLKDIKVDGRLQSDLGDLEANINLGIAEGIDKLTYDGILSLKAFDIGTLLKNNEIGRITLKSELKGQGLQISDNNSKIKGAITDFDYNGYTYQFIDINAVITEGKINGQIDINDPNLKLQYDGLISIDNDNTTIDFSAKLDTINFYPLYLYKDSVSLSAMIESRFSLPLIEEQEQYLKVNQIKLSNPDDNYSEDSLLVIARKTVDSTIVNLTSDAINIQMDGRYNLSTLPSSIIHFINQYYNKNSSESLSEELNESIHIHGQVNTIKPVDIIIREDLVQSKEIKIDMDVDFKDSKLTGGLSVDSLFYSDYFSQKVDVSLGSSKDQMSVNIDAYQNQFNAVSINKVSFYNTINDNKIKSTLTAIDKKDLPKIKLSTEIVEQDSSVIITVQDSLILNNEDWIVDNTNTIEITDGQILFNNFGLTNGTESLRVNSLDNEKELDIDFDNFDIGQFVHLLTDKASDLTGAINGNVKVKNIYQQDLYYIVNLVISDMTYDSTNVGVLKIDAHAEPNSSLISTDISLEGISNHVNGGGTYNTKSTELDFSLNVDAFELKLLDPFLTEIISESDGIVRGNATLNGTPSRPEVNGSIKLEEVITTIVANNSRYRIDNHDIYFDNESIDIGILDIYDQDENIATFTGNIYHKLLSDFEVDLIIETSKFTFLNTTVKENPVFYGKVIVDAVGIITGPPDLLDVNVTATSVKGTDITISPFSAEAYLEEDYITYGRPEDFEDLTNEYLLKLAQVYPFDVNLLLDVDEKSELTFIVDPISGDKISVNGIGNLRIKLNPDGEQEFFGNYTINEGEYTFTYGDFIAKDFKINPGGTVKFNGNPLNATLNIDAIYNVYTTTYELIKNQPFISDDERAASKKRTNVEVYLTINGKLEQPEILLDIKIPNLQSSTLTNPVDTRLNEIRNNPNELNNQVFGLILFDNFIISDNTSPGFDNIGSNLALSSISNLISNQLNKFAQNIIKGVDVNINVNSYDSRYVNNGEGGNITEVGLNVSKQLFNDRLSISATGNIDIEGDQQADGYTSFIGDFVLEYKLTEDGRYRLRVFSKNDFDRIENENSNKNGVSLFYKKSFDAKNEK